MRVYLHLAIIISILFPFSANCAKWCGSGPTSNIIPDELPGLLIAGCISVDSAKFYHACKAHDNCYDSCGKSHVECDRTILHNLEAECKTAFNTIIEKPCMLGCYAAARSYYETMIGVQYEGFVKAYKDAQKKCQGLPSFAWSQAGPISGQVCIRIYEDADPHAWSDNYLCSSRDLGLNWSQAGPIAGMSCTRIYEDADPHAWGDNYLCVPQNSSFILSWSQAGPIPGKACTRIYEDADPHAWSDNYLCIE
ncbi:MAG: hypothetical protein F9K25_19570 [Candidatus Contendobacter sp.]|nr:MAG: hypothetical protein F9K25_19570 [Candidatus Contendobacter sp.]